MKVQEINTIKGLRYILLYDNYQVVIDVKNYLKFLDNTGKSPNTLKNYAYHLKIFYEYMQIVNIDVKKLCSIPKLGPIDILSDFLLYLQYPNTVGCNVVIYGVEPKRSNITVNIIMDTVLAYYQYLANNNQIEELEVYRRQRTNERFKPFLYEMTKKKNIVHASIFKKRETKHELEYITRNQFNELLEKCRNTRDKLLIALLYEGGLRIGEALGIHLVDIADLEDGVVHIEPRENNENGARVKNYAKGIIKVPDYVVDILLKYLNEDVLNYNSDYLFINLYGVNKGAPMTKANVEKLFERISSEVGYHVHPHMLRHGFATEKKEFGWDMSDISAYLRHKDIQSTRIYITYTDDLKKEKMREFIEKKQIQYGGAAIDSRLSK